MTITFKVYDAESRTFTPFRMPADGERGRESAMHQMIGMLANLFPEQEWTFIRTGKKQYSVVRQVGQA